MKNNKNSIYLILFVFISNIKGNSYGKVRLVYKETK
ncbi:MAG: hypothetical protein Ta2D_08830 [Rickettsiales bacterium]|nr:MAG: hypothetical protein Ta2D_08830 [Rickettsiales bacterium]